MCRKLYPPYKKNRFAHRVVAARYIRTHLVLGLESTRFLPHKMKISLLIGAALAAGANSLAIEARQRPRPTSTQAGIPDGERNVLVYLEACDANDEHSNF